MKGGNNPTLLLVRFNTALPAAAKLGLSYTAQRILADGTVGPELPVRFVLDGHSEQEVIDFALPEHAFWLGKYFYVHQLYTRGGLRSEAYRLHIYARNEDHPDMGVAYGALDVTEGDPTDD